MKRDTLFLIETGFADPGYKGADENARFYCPYCATIEGVIALHPALFGDVDVVRVPFQRPRTALVDLIGEANQGLPRLILADDAPGGLETGSANGVRFVSDVEQILDVLSRRHGLPRAHF
ncbi:DUF3088 domain-containing protein [Allosphingosinicella vermicomposti]|uniref:DUF3088 domain-containing protein n=1 Tax=Allosphingosinicella vermicomposti TaxID=614671 RepID=UPI000D0EDB79|nr:DUF3088 domain-containing protein [Allosphingosinicella vermicomposti]